MDQLKGKRTYIVGIVMMLHAASTVVLDLMNGKQPDQMSLTEFFTGLGFITMRAGMNK